MSDIKILKTILVVFCWFSGNNKMVFWAENQQKTKTKQFSAFFKSDMLKANCFLPSIIIPHITMTKANSEFENSLVP